MPQNAGMRWSIIRLIFMRELRDQLRDRRTLFMIAILPLFLYPVLGFAVLQFALGFTDRSSDIGYIAIDPKSDFPLPAPKSAQESARAAIVSQLAALATLPGAHPLTGVTLAQADAWTRAYPPFLRAGNAKHLVEGKTPQDFFGVIHALAKTRFRAVDGEWEEAVNNHQVDLVLKASPDFIRGLQTGEAVHIGPKPTIEVLGKVDSEPTKLAWQRVQTLLDAWKQELKLVRLERLGLPSDFDDPIALREPTMTKAASGGETIVDMMIRIFPFMLVMWSLAGALYPAVDLCAGEKERGTMETLLISPAGREEIVLGKFLTIWVFSAGTAYLNLISMGVTTWQFSHRLPTGSLPLAAILWCMVLLLPLSAFFSAISLAVGAYARSSKEGQYYLMPLFLVTMPLIFLTLAPGVELNAIYSLIPVTGVALLMQRLMTATSWGEIPWLYFGPVLVPIALYSGLALRWAIDQFHREEVLFREAERLDILLWLKKLLREKAPTPTTGEAYFLFGLIMLLRWVSWQFGGRFGPLTHMGISLLAFVIAPVLVMTVMLNSRPLEGLRLAWPTWRDLGLAAILAVLLLPPLAAAAIVVLNEFPHLTRLLEQGQPLLQELRAWKEGLEPVDGRLWPHILIFALLPAIAEELAFRGFILTGLQTHYRPRTAILLSSFLFGLYYLNVFQFLPAFFLSVVLGLLTVRSRSILPAMLLHFLHNSVLILGLRLFDVPEAGLSIFAAVGCSIAAGSVLWWLYRKPYADLEREQARLRDAAR